MAVAFRTYTGLPGYTEDFHRVCDFLIRVNRGEKKQLGMNWVRWEWAFAKGIVDEVTYGTVGLWEDRGEIVGLAAYEERPGDAWLVVDSAFEGLKGEMFAYACGKMRREGRLAVSIDDGDRPLQRLARAQGFRPTQRKEQVAVLDISPEAVRYALPGGFRILSLADEFDMRKYNRVMWEGFDHEGPPPETESMLAFRRDCVSSPHSDRSLQIVVAAPDGSFASHCGMWYLAGSDYAFVEPVATRPAFRRLGLGRAAVREGIRRCAALGARQAFVGSSQPFYYRIGFNPCSNETFWSDAAE